MATLSIRTGPIDNLTGGWEGSRGIRIPPIPATRDGMVMATGLVPTRHNLNLQAPGYWLDGRAVDLLPGQTTDVGTITLQTADRVTVTTLLARAPSFAGIKAVTQSCDGSGGWSVGGAGPGAEYLLFLHRPDGREVRLRSSFGPFEMADLGEGTLEDLAKLDHAKARLAGGRGPLAISGHVYLGHWPFSDDWVLFHLTREKMTPEEAARLGPQAP